MADAQNPLLSNLPSQGAGVTPPADPNMAAPDVQQSPQQVNDLLQRPIGTGVAAQPQKPSDRKEFFRSMLSNFMYSFAAGAANSGTGPGSDVRGAGAAILAPYQKEQQQKELALQQQQVNSQQAYQQAEAERARAQGTMVTLPNGVMVPAQAYASMVNTGANVAGRQSVADTNAGARTGIAQIAAAETDKKIASSADVAKSRIDAASKLASFRAATQKELFNMRAQIASDPNKATIATKNMAQTAQQIIPHLSEIDAETDKVASQLGPLAGRWNDYMTGKVGAPNPEFAHYMDQITFLESAVTLAHSRGRVSNLIFDEFKKMFAAGKQSPENMKQAISVTRNWMQGYADMGGLADKIGGTAKPGKPGKTSDSLGIR